MALFDGNEFSFVHDPSLNPGAHLVSGFPASPPSLASVHWVYDPAFGFPERPHEVSILRQEIHADGYGHTIPDLFLDAANGYRASFRSFVAPEDGAICVTAVIDAAESATEIYATDVLGDEVPGTRQLATAPQGAAFLGPQVFGLQATGEARLLDVTIFSIPRNFEGEFETVALVAPNFPAVPAYQQQYYLGDVLDASRALEQRLWADAIARQNTGVPSERELEDRIHRRNPHSFAQDLMANDFHAIAETNFAALMVSPSLEVQYPIPDSSQEVTLRPASLWQYLACSGSVEAATLGQAVTLPLRDPSPVPVSGAEIYQRVKATARLPFPVIRVVSHFGKAAPSDKEVSYARLALPLTGMAARVAPTAGRGPTHLDDPATADLELRLLASRAHAGHFIARQGPNGRVYEREPEQHDPPPRLFFFSGEAEDHSQDGAPIIRLGPVDLPLTGPAQATVYDQPRDVFGRWPDEIEASCTLEPWPVSPPALLSSRVSYRPDGIAELSLTLGWDWTLRRPYELRIGLCIGDGGSTALPSDGLLLPDGNAPPLLIRFDAADRPSLHPDGMHNEFSVETIPLHDLAPGVPPVSNDLRSYLLTGPLGQFDGIFDTDDTVALFIVADALEQVSGQTEDRRSRRQQRSESLSDPRPPMIVEDTWRLIWTARPNGAGVAVARIPRPQISAGGGKAQGFNLWRAGETAVLDLAIAARFGGAPQGETLMAAIRAERNRPLRLRMIRGLVGNLLPDAEFRRDFVNLFAAADSRTHQSDVELDLPGNLDGFEFGMYSAMSSSGIPSDKTEMKHLVAIAVPRPRPPARPNLRLITDDPRGLLPLGGHWLALVGTDGHIDPKEIRFFWDVYVSEVNPDQLLYPLTQITTLSIAEAEQYLPEVGEISSRMGRDAVHFLMLAPPQGWSPLAVTAEIVAEPPGVPEERAVSPRSAIATGFMPPLIGPRLVLRSISPDKKTRVVSQSGLFTEPFPGFTECEVFFEIATLTPDRPLRVEPTPLASYTVDAGVFVGNDMTARYDTTEEVFYLTYSGAGPAPAVTMICTDPAGRAARIKV